MTSIFKSTRLSGLEPNNGGKLRSARQPRYVNVWKRDGQATLLAPGIPEMAAFIGAVFAPVVYYDFDPKSGAT